MTADRSALDAVDESTSLVNIRFDEYAPDVVTVELDRSDQRNALNAELRREIHDVCSALGATEGIRSVVITGSPAAGAFAAGGDIREMRERDVIEQRTALERPRIYEAVADLSIPVVARITGYALGGGCELAMACDLRLAHSEATLGLPEINPGIFPGGGGTQRLPRLVGEGQAMRLILTGERIDASEASEIGLIEECYEDIDALDGRICDLATSFAEKSTFALTTAKKAIRASSQLPLDDGIEYEAELFTALFATGEKNEGIDAFLEDRDPEWQY